MAIFHNSNFGKWARTFNSDLDGFVATTAEEVKALRWEDDISDTTAKAKAAFNAWQLDAVEYRLAGFRN